MKRIVALLTAILSIWTSPAFSDETFVKTIPVDDPSYVAEGEEILADEKTPKQVGKASTDSTEAARRSNATKYVLAGAAVVVGITALILVSRHHGHRSHHSGQ